MGEESEALKADIEQRREAMSGTIDAIEDRVVPSRIIERRRAAITGWASGAKERVMGSAHSAGDGVSHAAGVVTDAPAKVQGVTKGSPLIAGAVAFGIGALVAVLLPESQAEQQAVSAIQPQLAAATEAVKDAGQQALEAAKSSSQDAAQELKESATAHAQEVKSEAQDAGQQVKEAATESAD
jgi:hypothetical protein